MEALKFTLSGRTAFFKKPEVNSYFYFTYGNIHKIALMGLLGAIMGYSGYNQQKQDEDVKYPEFYEKLKNIKIGIEPKNKKGYTPKKIQIFNNSVGYASQEKGGNLIVKEQWLENPRWDIYILLQGEIEKRLEKRLQEKRFVYLPYLGKNDHIANITDVQKIEELEKQDQSNKIDSLFLKDYFKLVDNMNLYGDVPRETTFKYQENLPITLDEKTNKYEFETFVYTNSILSNIKDSHVYLCNNKNIFFF